MSPQEAQRDVVKLGGIIAQAFNDAKTIVLLDFEGKQKQRIFNDGLASDGSAIETRGADKKRGVAYTKKYEKVRQKAGRQIGYKDLQFSGDLEKGMQVGTLNGEPVYGFVNDKERLKAEGATKFAGKDIFPPNDDELKSGNDIVLDYVQKELAKNGY